MNVSTSQIRRVGTPSLCGCWRVTLLLACVKTLPLLLGASEVRAAPKLFCRLRGVHVFLLPAAL